MSQKIVDSKAYTLKEILSDKYVVDFYQREYVWQRKQIEDLISDLSLEFLKNWSADDDLEAGRTYDPYFMGELVLSITNAHDGRASIIDGQQRITSFTLLLIYLIQQFGDLPKFPKNVIESLIYSESYGTMYFNLDIEEREKCLLELYNNGSYTPTKNDTVSVYNIVERYADIADCWNDKINDENAAAFAYWLSEKVIFSKVWTNSDDFAYVIFETMNDRGLSLTQVEMLRGYLLASVSDDSRIEAMKTFDNMTARLADVKLSSNQKADNEFFKLYFRSCMAETLSQSKGSRSDVARIGNEFHRWVRDNNTRLGLVKSEDYVAFIDKMSFFADVYIKLNSIIAAKDTENFLYVIVNNDYTFTLQPAPIMAAIKYKDSDDVINKKIKIVSKYFTRFLTWKVWNHQQIGQSTIDASVFALCKELRDKTSDELAEVLAKEPLDMPSLSAMTPTLNQQNKKKIRVLLSLITEIVAANSGETGYMLNKKKIEVEHIWANHYERHSDEVSTEAEFSQVRNNIGDLLVLPESFNKSYGDDVYAEKSKHYIEQNILAQTLNPQKYENNPGFIAFMEKSGLDFKPYETFDKNAIYERADLYRRILLWNWGIDEKDDARLEEKESEGWGITKEVDESHLDLPMSIYLKQDLPHEPKRSCHAEGLYFGKGKVAVLKGGQASSIEHPDLSVSIADLRKDLLDENGVILDDHEFATPSAAGEFVRGRGTDGWWRWKAEDGTCLNDVTGRSKLKE